MKVWFFLIILSLGPWNLMAISEIAGPDYRYEASRCVRSYACYYDGTIYIDVSEAVAHHDLYHALFHETQHHMQCRYRIWRTPGGWDVFMEMAKDLTASGELKKAQALAIRPYLGCSSCQHELHAELPWILRGEIPCGFAPWYPWFDLSECEA